MFSTRVLSVLSLALSFVASSRAGVLNINTPSLIQCKSAYLSWEGDYSPFNVTIVNQKNGTLLQSFGLKSTENITWTVNVPSGSTVALRIRDAKGNINYSAGVTVKPGTDSSCLNHAVVEPTSTGRIVVAGNWTATATAGAHAPLNTTMSRLGGNGTLPGVSSGNMGGISSSATSGIGANAAATTSAHSTSSAIRSTAGLGFLLACLTLALAA